MAYHQPVRYLYDGDKIVAGRYVREARRLIENMLAQLPSDTPAGRRIFRYPDGTSVEIIIADMQVTAIIRTRKPKPKIPRAFDDFVVTPRSSTWPDGTDPAHPQMIIRAPLEGDKKWHTYFFDRTNPVYDIFGGAKGTYKNNPNGEPLFPEGIVHAGNVDWRGPNGERISWYGPDSRYFFDTYRQPRDQYGRFVFNLGQVLFDVDKYCTDNNEDWYARLIVGACLREHDDGTWLYMMMADMPDVSTPTQTVGPNEVYFSENFPLYDVNYRLRRVRLREDLATSEAMKWSPVDGTAEQLWTAFAYRGCNPWVFNTAGTKMTTFALVDSPVFLFTDDLSNTLGNVPPAAQDRIDVDLTNPTSPTFETSAPSIAPGVSAADTAVDYADDGTVIPILLSREAVENSPHALVLRMGQFAYPMWFEATPRAGFNYTSVRRRLTWMDAREQFLVCEELVTNIGASNYSFEFATVVMYRGAMVARRINATDAGAGLADDDATGALEACKDVAVAPLAFMWMLRANVFLTTYRASIGGLTASQVLQPYLPAATFGQFGARAGSTGPSTAVASYANSGFANNPADVHGHRVSFSGAARAGIGIYSGWFDDGTTDPKNQSASFVSGNSLAGLTGVGGTNARYHPIWLLGQPIGGDRPVIATP